GTETRLSDGEPRPLLTQEVGNRDPDVVETDLGVATPVLVTEDGRRSLDHDARSVHRHQHHRLLVVTVGIRVGHAHDDRDLAAGRRCSRGEPLAAADHVLVAVPLDTRRYVRGVGAGDGWLGHREARTDLTIEEGRQPALLLLL